MIAHHAAAGVLSQFRSVWVDHILDLIISNPFGSGPTVLGSPSDLVSLFKNKNVLMHVRFKWVFHRSVSDWVQHFALLHAKSVVWLLNMTDGLTFNYSDKLDSDLQFSQRIKASANTS